MMKLHRYQSGAALFISMMFLFLMTIIGINALNSATTDERMALNMQHQEAVFHAAESAINVAKRDNTTLEGAITGGAPQVDYPNPPIVNHPVGATATVSYLDCGAAPGDFSIELGASGVVAHIFEINAIADYDNSGAHADHTQGTRLIRPSGGLSCG